MQTRLVIALGNWIPAGTGRGQVFIPLDVRLDDRHDALGSPLLPGFAITLDKLFETG